MKKQNQLWQSARKVLVIAAILLIALPTSAQTTQTHIVKRGETFASIAPKYGITESELRTANPNAKNCYAGTKLKIILPKAAENVATVKKNASSNSNGSAKKYNEVNEREKNHATTQMKEITEKKAVDDSSETFAMSTVLGHIALNNKEYKKAFGLFKYDAEKGNPDAQNMVGIMYYAGNGVSQNYAEAFKWFKKAAEQGDKNAQVNFGAMYYDGKGVSQNYAEAFKWFKKAAEQGDKNAQVSLGAMYYDGKGVSQNYAAAFKWIKKAAEQGHPLAQAQLGKMYGLGYGITKNWNESYKWCLKAAEQGDDMGQCLLGILYYKGKVVCKNDAEARKWLKRSAEQGNINAKKYLKEFFNE